MHDHDAPPLQSLTLMLGSAYSGSSLVGQTLNDIVGIAYAGELETMHRFGFPAYADRPERYRSHCSICVTHAEYDCPVFTERKEPIGDAASVEIGRYLEVLHRFNAPHVIDGSKNTDWLWYLVAKGLLQAIPTRVLLVTRSVWAYAASHKRSVGHTAQHAAQGWRNIYRHALRSTASLGIPMLVVRHEDFVGNLDAVLSRAAWFINGQPHNVLDAKALHTIGGNTSAHAVRPEFDRAGELRHLGEREAAVAREKFAYFGGSQEPRQDALRRWAFEISPQEAHGILAMPEVLDTMLDLGYDPLRMLDEYKAMRVAA
ncbi:MAG: hypothetical protein ACTHKZ_04140 [Lysobacteraceae bacterium]